MSVIVLALNLLAAAGLLAVALKYLTGPAPAAYHASMFEKANALLKEIHVDVLRALYRNMGAAFLALTVALAALAWFAGEAMWGRIAIIVIGLIAGFVSTISTYSMEKKTGVGTPWRAAAAIVVLLVVAFVLSFVA